MARPRKPTELKKLIGTYREDRETNLDPVRLPAVNMPAPPAAIAETMTAGALDVWAMLEPGLSGAGLLTNENMFQLVRYCTLMDEWRTLHQKVDKLANQEGTQWVNQRLMENLKAAKVIHDQLQDIDRAFGIMPLFSDAIKSRDTKEESELDKLMRE